MNVFDKIDTLNDIAADLDDLRERLLALGNLNANITGPIGDAIAQIDIAVTYQQDIANQEPKSEVELQLERLIDTHGIQRVKPVCYDLMLKEMNGGTAV